jgi:D-arabinose 1-dehydrogenase-like Zn-dependent alcohol dehydrogenase
MNGKVAIFREAYKEMEFKQFPVPDPHPDGMMVKLRVANICGSDLHFWRGHSPGPKGMPIILGHEMLGTVFALGNNVNTDSAGQPLKEGDRVCFSYFKRCGRCAVCVSGKGFCPYRIHDWVFTSAEEPPYFKGAYGEYYYLKPGQWVYKIPDDLSDDLISPVNCALSEVVFGLNKIGVEVGDTVVIQGAGGLGLYATSVAKEMGAAQVIVVDKLPDRLELAKEMGANHILNAGATTSAERIEFVRERTGGLGADVCAELAGTPVVMEEGIQLLRQGGKYLWIGCIALHQKFECEPALIIRGWKTIFGVVGYESWVIPKALDFLRRTQHKYPFHKIVSHKFKFEQINEAFAFANAGKAIRVSLEMGD